MKSSADFSQPVLISEILPINKGLSSATEPTMISILGSPHVPLNTSCQNEHASDLVNKHKITQQVSKHVKVTGLSQAVKSLRAILGEVFHSEPDLEEYLETQGMLCVRHRKPTSGLPSTHLSNHSWGTAIDFNIHGQDAPGNTGKNVPKFIALMVPFFNQAGWYSGIAFRDSMHFEVAEETIRSWSSQGLL